MFSSAWLLMSAALVLAGSGLFLWDLTNRRKARQVANQTLAKRMALEASSKTNDLRFGNPTSRTPPTTTRTAETVALPEWLLGALTSQQVLGGLALLTTVCLLVGLLANWFSALGLLALGLLATTFVTWLRLQKMRAQLVRQLPGFLDVMVRLIRTGNSTQSAFQQAVSASAAPLRLHMDNAMSLVRADRNIDQALQHIAEKVRVDELYLLASILGLGVRYGGRSDVLLERVANFMRDHEEMEHELVAMSSEIRMSAWILSLLPLFVGGAIVVLNSAYFGHMWNDATGQHMIFSALALQVAGVFLLYRLARLE